MDNIISLTDCNNALTTDTSAMNVAKANADTSSDSQNDTNVINDPSFSLSGYQVVRGEFFSHLFEPSVTLNKEKVSVNSACIRKLPKTDYVQFLINRTEKKLVVKPCSEETRDSLRWSSTTSDNRVHPKQVTCKMFFAMIMNLMGWDPRCRYKILGKLIRTRNDCLFVFDLSSAEMYRKRNAGEKTSPAVYPESWNNQFGISAEEHQENVLIKYFDDNTVFTINIDEEEEGVKNESDKSTNSEQSDCSSSAAGADASECTERADAENRPDGPDKSN